MLNNIAALFRTLYYLKPIQIFFQIKYKLKESTRYVSLNENPVLSFTTTKNLSFSKQDDTVVFNKDRIEFKHLNIYKSFSIDTIDWNDNSSGKLWTYHLNYFNYLSNCSKAEGLTLITSYINNAESLKDGLEPYPTSLRIISWVKFCCTHNIHDSKIDKFIYADLIRLNANIEFHIQANHLLENAFALYIGSLLLNNSKILTKSRKLLINELNEQFGRTSLHYEGSFMYHLVLLNRMEDVSQILQLNTSQNEKEVSELLGNLIANARGVVKTYISANQLAAFNDANEEGCFYSNNDLKNSIGFTTELKEYPFFLRNNIKVIADYAHIAPSYQPGHAHADTFTFVVHYKDKPIIVDRGISTYEKNSKRVEERSTLSHNTMQYAGENSSEVWGGFRVGRRAKVFNLHSSKFRVSASHNGYRHLGAFHKRTIDIQSENELKIFDEITEKKNRVKISSIHFHPNVSLLVNKENVVINNDIIFSWVGVNSWNVEEYDYCIGFNKTSKASVWRGSITNNSVLKFKFINEN